MAFWAVEVKPGKPYVHEPSCGCRLRISQATLGNYDDVGWCMLECSVGDMRPVRLCALNPMSALMCHLDLEYEEKENVALSVLGACSIHLSGYYICSHNADHGHKSEKPTGKAMSHGGDTDCKNDASLRKLITSEYGDDNGDSHRPIPIALSKRTAKKTKCKKPSIEQVPNDQTNGMGQVNEERDYKIMDPSAVDIAPSQAHEITQDGNALQNAGQEQHAPEGQHDSADQIIGQTGPIITISDEGAANLQGVEKQNEEADNCEIGHAGVGPIHNQTIEDLIVGSAATKMSSSGNKIPCSASKITSSTCLKRKYQGGHTDGKNDDSLKKPIVFEDGSDNGYRHFPIPTALSKRTAKNPAIAEHGVALFFALACVFPELFSDDEEVPPHLRALADAAQIVDVEALFFALACVFPEICSDDEEVPPHLRPLRDAAQIGDVEALRAALDNHGGNIDVPVEDGDTLLHLACLYGYLPCVQLLLEYGASVECKDEEGAIPLHDACVGGFTEIVQYILNFAANKNGCIVRMLNTVDSEGDTPLHHAARGEHLDVVKLLLEAGACPKKENSFGQTPADMADQDTEVRTLLTAKQIEVTDYCLDCCMEQHICRHGMIVRDKHA